MAYRAKKNIQRKGYCEVVPCDQRAVAVSVIGMPICLAHGYKIGGFTLTKGHESLIDFEPNGDFWPERKRD